MRRLFASLRRPALLLISAASLVIGGAALWAWITPETVHAARTAVLLGLLALMALPVATLASLAFDRRRGRHTARAGQRPLAATAAPASFVEAKDLIAPASARAKSVSAALPAARHEPSAGPRTVSGARPPSGQSPARARSAPSRSPLSDGR